ncbi:MAG: Uncharacterised protein [Flavobacterium sp. SCGC AAA160-P02]|nr:MAG: Uncharacterised protein [Flavobacterium sp. SCGC AAA160-P02]
MSKFYISLIIIFNISINADEISIDEMVEFIVQEQFISQQEDSMKNSMYTMMESMGLNVKSKTMSDFLDPLLNEYLSSVEKKMPALYKDIYSDDEILALYNFMKTQEGISITNKQPLMIQKSMLVVSEDAVKFSKKIGIAFQENPELIQSLRK